MGYLDAASGPRFFFPGTYKMSNRNPSFLLKIEKSTIGNIGQGSVVQQSEQWLVVCCADQVGTAQGVISSLVEAVRYSERLVLCRGGTNYQPGRYAIQFCNM